MRQFVKILDMLVKESRDRKKFVDRNILENSFCEDQNELSQCSEVSTKSNPVTQLKQLIELVQILI